MIDLEKPIGAPMHRSATEPVLIAGMARKPATLVFIAAAALIGSGLHWYTISLAALIVVAGGYGVRRLTAWDPQFEVVLSRYVRYRRRYSSEIRAGRRRSFFGRSSVLPGISRPAVPTMREVGQ